MPRLSSSLIVGVLAFGVAAFAARPAAAQDNAIGVRGFVTFGSITLTAEDSFDAVLGRTSGPIVGGGGQVLLPWGIYVQVGAGQFKQDGERVFVGPNQQVFRLGIPLEITMTPVEVTGGWRFRRWRQVVPYGGGGFTQLRYKETSEFADPGENVDERFNGFHLVGGVEYQPLRWLAIGGELAWSTVPDAIGAGGVSAIFNEDDLGGTTLRVKVAVGR